MAHFKLHICQSIIITLNSLNNLSQLMSQGFLNLITNTRQVESQLLIVARNLLKLNLLPLKLHFQLRLIIENHYF